ncbi:hypothetical protein CWC05_23760, partial [Pseudoalteromonas ruthenica]
VPEKEVVYRTSTQSERLKERILYWAQQQLPTHMIPAVFIFIESLPLTRNGKIDKTALPHFVSHTSGRTVKPEGALEERMRDIWLSVLGLRELGVEDDFFRIGGSSLTAISLITRVNIAFNTQLNVRDIFLNTTIRELVKKIVTMSEGFKYTGYQLVDCSNENFDKPFPLTNIQQAYLYGRL